MTLGGLALAVGILVDDATVEIENIHRNLGQRKPILQAILDGAQQIAVPAFVSTLCICIVFVPVIFLTGAARYLFTPLALAVVLAMMASYLLSRTLVPTMVHYLLRGRGGPLSAAKRANRRQRSAASSAASTTASRRRFEQYAATDTAACWPPRWRIAQLVAAGFVLICAVVPRRWLPSSARISSRRWTPARSACTSALRPARASKRPSATSPRSRTRIRQRDSRRRAHRHPRQHRPALLAASTSPSATPPPSARSTAKSWSRCTPASTPPPGITSARCARRLNREFPELTFFFQPADIVGQILNFGLPAPIDVQVIGPLANAERQLRAWPGRSSARMARIPGAVDVHLHQVVDVPELRFNVDRTRAEQLGLTQQDVANSLLISLTSSTQIAPNYWIDPRNGVDYPVAVQTPAVPRGFHRRAAAHAHPRRRRGIVAAVARQRGAPRARHHRLRWSTTTTCSRSSMSTPTCRTATWARVAADVDARAGRFHAQAAQGQLHRNARPGRDHAQFVHRPGRRAGLRHRAGLLRDGGQLPVLARSVHHPDGAARRACRASC